MFKISSPAVTAVSRGLGCLCTLNHFQIRTVMFGCTTLKIKNSDLCCQIISLYHLMSCCYMKHLLNPVFMQVKGKKFQKGFQALQALVAKKLSLTVSLQLCWIFFFPVCMVFRQAICQWLEYIILLFY